MFDVNAIRSSLYTEFYSIWKKELESNELVQLSSDFDLQIEGVLKKEREQIELQAEEELAQLVYDRFEFLYRDLKAIRFQKILVAVLNNQLYTKKFLTRDEEELQQILLQTKQNYFSEMKKKKTVSLKDLPRSYELETKQQKSVQHQSNEVQSTKSSSRIILRFEKSVSKFVGFDGRTYGPFSAQDIANIPIQNAKPLISKAIASGIDVE